MRLRLILYFCCTVVLYAFYVPAQALSSVACYIVRLARLAVYFANRRAAFKTVSTRS